MYSIAMSDMAKTPDEVTKELTPYDKQTPDSVNKYPYGLCISLTEADLAKLSTEPDCEAGDMIMLHAIAKVTSISKQEKEDGSCRCRIELQITHLALEGDDTGDEKTEAA